VIVYILPQALFRVNVSAYEVDPHHWTFRSSDCTLNSRSALSTCTISGRVGPEFYLHILQRCDAIHQSPATPPVPNQTPSEVIANFRADESPILAISSPKRRHELVLWNISRGLEICRPWMMRSLCMYLTALERIVLKWRVRSGKEFEQFK